jgi:hypothetical protein
VRKHGLQRAVGWGLVGLALVTVARPVDAAPPDLREVDEAAPRSARTGQRYTFRIQYRDPDGDPPKTANLVTEGPEGIQHWKAEAPSGNRASYLGGQMLEFEAGPFSGGEHRARFEVESIDGKARYPATGGIRFNVENLWLKWLELLIGLAVALLFLPLMMFVLVRAVNPQSDPSRAARFGLLVGLVASYALFVFLFSGLYPLPMIVILGILVLGALFALVPRRV